MSVVNAWLVSGSAYAMEEACVATGAFYCIPCKLSATETKVLIMTMEHFQSLRPLYSVAVVLIMFN